MDFKLEYKVDEEYIQLYNDLVKFVTILIVLNLLMFLSNPDQNVLMGQNYVKLIICVVLGLVTYWLVISKIIIFD
jgi:hypothetical protein